MNSRSHGATLEPAAATVRARPLYADVSERERLEAIRRLSTRIETLPDSPWAQLWKAQRDLFELHDRSALDQLYRMLTSAPSEVREAACHELGQIYRHRGEHRRALSFYVRAASEGAGRAASLVGRAETHVELGEPGRAEVLYREAIAALLPTEAPVAVAAGRRLCDLLARSGRREEAREVLTELFRRYPLRIELRRFKNELG